jgi:serine/threonine protein kinase
VPGYTILGELGRGGMGVVYRARQDSLNRPVALKLLRDGALAGPRERARFRIEADAAARMRHPNIVAIYEVGEHQGRPYFAMELVEGGALDKYLAGRPQPAAQAAVFVRALALAIEHAHSRNVIHRDLKPANILLVSASATSAGGESEDARPTKLDSALTDYQPKITDFGLAKRLDSQSTAWTQEGAVLGTAGYMAPEQAAGRVHDIGPPTDVYALGAILYEVLTGRPPFAADSWNQAIEQVVRDEPTPPARLRPDVPDDLDTVCLKCLEKEPARRYPSATALAEDLGRFLQSKPVTAVPLSAAERLARLAARDGYQLGEEIGRGPRSTIYRALYGPLNQPVALKVFTRGICTREAWEAKLRRDAELRAALAHPNIVPVHRGGWWDGAPYLAVEHVPQGGLLIKLGGKRLAIRQALLLVEQLAQLVRYLHRQGVVHGNLKPTNVLLAAAEIPRVTDFHTTSGLHLGSLPADDDPPTGVAYLPPEMIQNPGAEPRQYTDIYGLGAILYELLTGRPPFTGATAREVTGQVREQDPQPPSQLNPEVPPLLCACCLRCLRKDPWRRYTRAYDLLMRLRYLLDNSEPPAAPDERRSPRTPGSAE